MADLEVDLETLESFAERLGRIRRELDATHSLSDAVAEDLGSQVVRDAVAHFERHWRDGREKIDANAEVLETMVTEAVRAYRDTDQQLARDLESAMARKG